MGVPLGSYRDCRGTVSTLGVPRGICTGGEGACLDSLSDTGIQCIHGVCYREECNVRIYKRLPLRCARRTPPAVSYGDECVIVWEGGEGTSLPARYTLATHGVSHREGCVQAGGFARTGQARLAAEGSSCIRRECTGAACIGGYRRQLQPGCSGRGGVWRV